MAITFSNISKNVDGSYTGYCHTIRLKVALDGKVVSQDGANGSQIILGNQGDKNITQLIFDVSALSEAVPDQTKTLDDYQHVLIFDYGEPQPTSGLNYVIYELTPNTKYDSLSEDLYQVAPELTSKAGTFKMIYALLEKVEDEANGNTEGREIFISKEFIGVVNPTDIENITEEDISAATEIVDTEKRFTKNSLLISPSNDHYSISQSHSELGEKRDQFIRRIVLNESINSRLDEGLDYRIACFGNVASNEWTLTRMLFNNSRKNICSCFIPSEITKHAGEYKVFFIAQTDLRDTDGNFQVNESTFKRWVSNTITLKVNNNFLDDDDDSNVDFVIS